MRQGSVPTNPNSQPGSHFRRESGHSAQGEGAGRGNFQPQGGRGRGYNPHGNNYNQQMGYPPNNQFRNGPGQGRGMPPAFQPQPRNIQYPNSPQPARSPALVPSMPNTPNMPMQTPPQYHYPPPMTAQHQQVQFPPSHQSDKHPLKYLKKNKHRRELDKSFQSVRPPDVARELRGNDNSQQRRFSKRFGQQPWREHDAGKVSHVPPHGSLKPSAESLPLNDQLHPSPRSIDLSPENGVFEYMLTLKHQNFGYPPQQMDGYGRPMSMPYGYNNMPYMAPPQANSPGYNQNFVSPYHQQSHSMSRTPSQPERPPSANQQNQPVIVSSTPQSQNSQLKPTASSFVKMPKKSAALLIKNATTGEVIDTSTFKAPASPASSIQQSKTPPAVTSTPTPPPKSATPAHTRTDSHAAPKTAKQIQDELKEKIKQATQTAPAKKEEPRSVETPVEKPVEAKAEAAAPTKAEPEAKVPEAKQPEPALKTQEPTKQDEEKEDKKEEPAKTEDPEEDEIERMIREMEEADAKREAAAEEYRKKQDAEKAAAKAAASDPKNAAEEDRKLREQEREMERLEEEKEKRRQQAESGSGPQSVAEALAAVRSGKEPEAAKVDSVTDKLASMKIGDKAAPADPAGAKHEKRGVKPAALNLAPLNTKSVEPPQPSAALQSLKSARFLKVIEQDIYPAGIQSPNPALNAAVAKKGKTFKYDANFLLQFQKVFTEQPSLEFHQQVKSLIGDDSGRSASSRGQTPRTGSNRGPSTGGSQFNMGTFVSGPPSRPPATSAERFARSTQNTFPRPGGSLQGPSFSRGGSQPGSSSTGPRTNSGRPRGGGSSRPGRGEFAREQQAAKTMPLTAGMDIKPIAISSTGWKPTSVGAKPTAAGTAAAPGYLDPQLVQRKVKAALNKMTPEKFDKIADQILLIASQSKDESDGRTLRQVIQLTFEKATDEAHWASMYAKFCKRMLETMSPDVRDERIKDKAGNIVSGGNLFRKYLLNRCQEEFERGWAVNLPEAPKEEEEDSKKEKTAEAALLSDEYYIAAAAKRRGLGLVQFIGELYKLGMLTERIMHECVHKLVDYKGIPDEAEIESLSKLLRTIGANLDATEKGRPMMDAYFQRIQTMADLPELPSRLKFMLMDVVDLRSANWHSKEANKGPKTLDEVRAEAEAAQAAKAQESARSNQRGGRPPAGRGDARNFSAGYSQTSNQVGMDDLRRLKGTANRALSGNVTLGPTSMFSSRSNSGRRLGPGGALGRPGEDSGASSRTGTPPTQNTSHLNAFR